MQSQLRNIAYRVRRKMEKLQQKNDFCCWGKNLDCMCAIASIELFDILSDLNLNPKIAIGFCHAFVSCQGFYIDVTATQFGPYPKVMVRREMPNEDHWEIDGTYNEGLWDVFDGWPKDQNPWKWQECDVDFSAKI